MLISNRIAVPFDHWHVEVCAGHVEVCAGHVLYPLVLLTTFHTDLSSDQRRTLVLVSKILQQIANGKRLLLCWMPFVSHCACAQASRTRPSRTCP